MLCGVFLPAYKSFFVLLVFEAQAMPTEIKSVLRGIFSHKFAKRLAICYLIRALCLSS